MELNYLNYFFEVAKAGSFTKAAQKLRISQSALSKSVALLEDREGVKLLARSKKGVSLTTSGMQVFLKCEQLFQIVSEIEATCRDVKEVCEGSLSFGASDHLCNYFLIKKIQQVRSQHPKLVPRIYSGTPNDILDLIRQSEVEFGLFFTKVNHPGIKYESIFQMEMTLACHPRWAQEFPGPISYRNLKALLQKVGFIGSIRSQYQKHPSQELMDILKTQPHIVSESNSQETQKRLCLEGLGISFLARFMIEEELSSGALVEIPLKRAIIIPLYLARRNDRNLSLSARTFLQIIQPELKFASSFGKQQNGLYK